MSVKGPILIGIDFYGPGDHAFLFFRDSRGFKHRLSVSRAEQSLVKDLYLCASDVARMTRVEYAALPELDENWKR